MALSNKILSIRNIKLFNITRTISQLATKPEVNHSKDKVVMKPLEHVRKSMQQPAHIGPIDVYQPFNYWFKVPEDKTASIVEFMYLYQSSALLMDDFFDSTPYRYDMPVTQTIYGEALTVNSSYFGLLKALKIMSDLDLKAVKLCIDAGIELCRGQGIEVYWRDNLNCPTEKEYIDMIKQKSSSFLILAYKLHQLYSDREVNCLKVAEDIGIYHQILDDYRDMLITESADTKSFFVDLTEGKFTLPLIHAVNHSDDSENILNVLKLRTEDIKLKKWCISLLQKAGSFEYTRHKLSTLEYEIHEEIKRLGGNPEMIVAVEKLGNWRDINDTL